MFYYIPHVDRAYHVITSYSIHYTKLYEELRERTPEDRAALVVFSGDLDRVLAAFVIATGAAAAGLETSRFCTFWGRSVITSYSIHYTKLYESSLEMPVA